MRVTSSKQHRDCVSPIYVGICIDQRTTALVFYVDATMEMQHKYKTGSLVVLISAVYVIMPFGKMDDVILNT